MEPIWKYTVGLLVEVVIKVLQTLIGKDVNVIKGTVSKSTKE